MVIAGNTRGASFIAGAITSLGFTAGSNGNDNDFDISTKTADMVLTVPGASGNLAAYAFEVTVTHDKALVLDRNANGGAFDGFGFVNSSNANSALSILN
jgi:hypothetical protein